MEISVRNLFSDVEVRNMQLLSDGKLRTEDGCVFDIHRIALAESSRYFHVLFCGSSNTDSSDILIPGIRGEVLYKVLCYIYTGNFACTEDTLIDLLIVSDRLLLYDLQKKMKEYIKNNISTTNCFQILLASHQINQQDIFEISFRFMQIHFEEIASNVNSKMEELPVYVLKELLCSKCLFVKSEYIIWDVIVKWIEYDKPQRLVHAPDLLACLKAADVDPELAAMITEHDIVARNPFCKEVKNIKLLGRPTRNFPFSDFFQAHEKLITESQDHRLPRNIYIFTRDTKTSGKRSKDIYITHDENIDIWRHYKHVNRDDYFDIFFIGRRMYLLEGHKGPQNLRFFNIDSEGRIREPNNMGLVRCDCGVVKHRGLIYTLGGWLRDTGEMTGRVQVYNPALNTWNDVASMIPIVFISVASLGSKIYVTGNEPGQWHNESVIVQEYDPESDSWTSIARPTQRRHFTYLTAYHDRLYLIGMNSKIVELFDPVTRNWYNGPELPFAYNFPWVKVLQDHLIVHESDFAKDRWSTPMIHWSDETECWQPIENSSPLSNIFRYNIITVEDAHTIKALTANSKKRMRSFEKSPFN